MSHSVNDKIINYMANHLTDNISVIKGTTASYIEISKRMGLPTAYLQDIYDKLEALVDGKLIT